MPKAEEIVSGLRAIANTWTAVAVFWHVYFAAIVGFLLSGTHPSKRIIGILMGPPLLSVSLIAWSSGNPYTGGFFGLIGILVLLIAARLPRERVRAAQPQILLTGVVLFLFGWIYPYYLSTDSLFSYIYAAPTGLIPCPTLLAITGLCIVLNGLDSRRLAHVLGLGGLVYGAMGVFMLEVAIDVLLLLGAVSLLLLGWQNKQEPTPRDA
jgi:hypothetical protein